MNEQNLIGQRLIAVLDYDSIQPRKRAAHLASICGCSPSTARRWLSVDTAARNMSGSSLLDLARGLDVDLWWLWEGASRSLAPRTLRINLQQVNGYPKYEVDRMMRLFVAFNAGQRKAVNLFNMVMENKLTLLAASRLL